MRTLLLVCMGLLGFNVANAQFFGGGSGDGHAMTELVLRETGVNELTRQIQVYPTLLSAGQSIYVQHRLNYNLDATLTQLNGAILKQYSIEPNSTLPTSGVPPGLYLLQLSDGNNKALYKISIVH